MPSPSGEIRFDRLDLPDDAEVIAATLERTGVAAFHYAAFGTLHRMVVMESAVLDRGEVPAVVFGRGPDGVGNEHSLWMREGHAGYHGTWLNREQWHVAPYLRDRFDTTLIDGYALSVLTALVDESRKGHVRPDETLREWAAIMENERPADALPAFLGGVQSIPRPRLVP